MLAALDWQTVGAIAGAITAVLGAVAAVASYVSKLLARRGPADAASDEHDEPRTTQLRPPTYAFPTPESAVEDVLEGIVDSVNMAGYGFTLGEDYLSVGTPTAGRQWGGYYKLSGLNPQQLYRLADRRGFNLPIAVQRQREGSVRVAVDAAVLDSSLPVVSSLPGY